MCRTSRKRHVALGVFFVSTAANAAQPSGYHSITLSAVSPVVLTGDDLSIEALLQVARYGAQVTLSEAAKQRQLDNYGLLLEAQFEGVPVYGFNRGGGLGRSIQILNGDPLTPSNRALIEKRELAAFERGALDGDGPEIDSEELVRATMVIRANEMIHETPSPQLSKMLLDLLNADITPVMQSHGTVGESDWNLIPNIGAAMVGLGDVYDHGIRMGAALALQRAGLATLKPFATDSSTLANSNGFSTALAAFMVANGRRALEWADLAYALDLNAMNSSITPLSRPVQQARPFKWLNFDAARVLDMLKGSYLFDGDSKRILADPDSLRASAVRQGAAWQAWAALRDDVVLQMNTSDHNPTLMIDATPDSSWELRTPQMMKYFVKGGRYSNGHRGYIVSSANWDPFPEVNDIESLTTALGNVGVVVTQRIFRFENPFFTGVSSPSADGIQVNPILVGHWWQELQILAQGVPAEGASTDVQGNGDIESQAALKATRGLQAVNVLMHLLGEDLLNSAHWLAVRRTQDSSRAFGTVAEETFRAFRNRVPQNYREGEPPATLAYEFVNETPTSNFYPPSRDEPANP